MKHIVLLGDRDPNALTHREIDAALRFMPSTVRARWVGTDETDALRTTNEADGLWVVPGSPYRNEATVYAAITAARTSGQPFLGTCAGFQYAVIEFARHVAGLPDAEHAETGPEATTRVIERLSCSLVGQERLVTAVAGTRIAALCGHEPFVGFHWCNFGLSPAYVDRLAERALVVSARADDAGVEAVELPEHPFFVATLFQPQVGTQAAGRLHPVLEGFVAAVTAAR